MNIQKSSIRLFILWTLSASFLVFFQNCGPDFQAIEKTQQETEASDLETPQPDDNDLTEPEETLNCEIGFHIEGAVCAPNTINCSITNGTGQQTWQGSSYGACTVVSCQQGYRNSANSCVFSPTSCPITFGEGQTQANGSCLAVSCQSGYHLSSNSCVSNVLSCTIANGTGQRTWNGSSFGSCMVLSCQTGYIESNNQCILAPVVSNPNWGPRNSARVFISGHSLTDDPLASHLVHSATQRGDSIAYNQQIVLGSPLRVRTRGLNSSGWAGYSEGKNRNGGSGLNVINELRNPQTIGTGQRYDTLVITENHNSLEMIEWENTIGYLRHYHDRLIEGNTQARTLFYNSWLDINKSNPALWIDHEKKATVAWECVTSKINLSLQSINRSDRVTNLPVSAALVHLVERILADQVPGISGSTLQKMNTIFSDNVHLTNLGVYYVSLVTYAAVYGKQPTGAPPTGISTNTATELQSIAWHFINSYYSQTNPGVRDMNSCRSYVAQQVCSSYWTLKANTGSISGCQNYINGNNSPFRWPDSSFSPFPAP